METVQHIDKEYSYFIGKLIFFGSGTVRLVDVRLDHGSRRLPYFTAECSIAEISSLRLGAATRDNWHIENGVYRGTVPIHHLCFATADKIKSNLSTKTMLDKLEYDEPFMEKRVFVKSANGYGTVKFCGKTKSGTCGITVAVEMDHESDGYSYGSRKTYHTNQRKVVYADIDVLCFNGSHRHDAEAATGQVKLTKDQSQAELMAANLLKEETVVTWNGEEHRILNVEFDESKINCTVAPVQLQRQSLSDDSLVNLGLNQLCFVPYGISSYTLIPYEELFNLDQHMELFLNKTVYVHSMAAYGTITWAAYHDLNILFCIDFNTHGKHCISARNHNDSLALQTFFPINNLCFDSEHNHGRDSASGHEQARQLLTNTRATRKEETLIHRPQKTHTFTEQCNEPTAGSDESSESSTSRNAVCARNVYSTEAGYTMDTNRKVTTATGPSYANVTKHNSTRVASHDFQNAANPSYGTDAEKHYQVPSHDALPIAIDDISLTGGIRCGSQVIYKDAYRKRGIVRWIGYMGDRKDKIFAGIEMYEDETGGTDGRIGQYQPFLCKQRRGVYKNIKDLKLDNRYPKTDHWGYKQTASPEKQQNTFPVSRKIKQKINARHCTDSTVSRYATGLHKGIQGDTNSCYLDAMLYSMFTFTSIFDYLLSDEPIGTYDLLEAREIQRILREEIVYPLRKDLHLNRENVWRLRKKLEKIESVKGITGEQMDPEEFINALFDIVLQATPLLSINGQTSQYYQLFIEPKSEKRYITIDELLKESFDQSKLQLDKIPRCMILQLPRFGKDFKMFDRIIPSLVIDINDICKEGCDSCDICGALAILKCSTCKSGEQFYCKTCIEYHDRREIRTNRRHNTEHVNRQCRQADYTERSEQTSDKSLVPMELFAVICIETSHYVSFVRCGETPDAPWVFFDSMADRVGEENGYNIPRVDHVHNIVEFLNPRRLKGIEHNRNLPTLIKRLMCDGFIYMYQRAKGVSHI